MKRGVYVVVIGNDRIIGACIYIKSEMKSDRKEKGRSQAVG